MKTFSTAGTCARQILFNVENGVLTDLKFVGGCSGNLQAISKLCIGRRLEDIIKSCGGIRCQNATSCPDQLAKALQEYINSTSQN